jgi:DNA (cytosine-5)-methyltransferase 1
MKSKKVLSLFSGCGGMDLGFEGGFEVHSKSINSTIHPDIKSKKASSWTMLPKTSFKIVFANDILREARASYVPYFESRGSQHIFRSESIVDLVKKAECGEFSFPMADVVIGGFPCQDFSLAGKRRGLNSHKSHTGKVEDEIPNEENRGKLYMWMKKVIELSKPKVFVAENVKGLVSLGDVKKIIERDFRNVDEGYVVLNAKVLHAGNFGVPQTRERVIFLGFNKKYLTKTGIEKLEKGIIDPYPYITHYLPNQKASQGLMKYVSVGEVLKDLIEPEVATDSAQKAYSKAKFYGKHVQGQTEVNLDALGPTIRAEHHGNIEFRRLPVEFGGKYGKEITAGKHARRLTVRECARIQTFPDDYEFIRPPSVLGKEFGLSGSNAYKVIGNAVPPLLGYQIAKRLETVWDEIFKK